jgi:hypothetical protein
MRLTRGGAALVVLACLVGAAASACTLFVDTGGLAGDPAAAEAGVANGEGGADAEAGAPTPVDSGARPGCRLPIAAVAELDAGSGIAPETCSIGNALVRDGLVAGLDRVSDGDSQTINGTSVTACVRVDFGASIAADAIVVRAASAAQACTKACSSACGTNRNAVVYATNELGQYQLIADQDITPDLRDYTFPVTRAPFRYVIVCRAGGGTGRDDVVVDVIELCDQL